MKNFLIVSIMAFLLLMPTSVFAGKNISTENYNQNQLRFEAMIKCWNSLVLGNYGKMQCYGKTEVRDGYVAEVIIELQRRER